VPIVSYPPQGYGPQGHHPYGAQPPGYPSYGYGRPPSPALGYVTAILFIVCGALALMLAITGWSGSSENPDMTAALVGIAFSEDITGNVDFAISATMTVACTSLTFGLAMFSRVEFIRWVLAVVGGIVTVYYIYGMIWLLTNDAGEYIAMALVSWLLWLAATVVAVLPQTGRAMRGKQRQFQQGYPQGPPGYPPRY
jgi:hypothetical protein